MSRVGVASSLIEVGNTGCGGDQVHECDKRERQHQRWGTRRPGADDGIVSDDLGTTTDCSSMLPYMRSNDTLECRFMEEGMKEECAPGLYLPIKSWGWGKPFEWPTRCWTQNPQRLPDCAIVYGLESRILKKFI